MDLASNSDTDIVAGNRLLDELYKLCRDLAVPTPSTYGVPKKSYFDSIPTMVEQAIASGGPANNPLIPDAADVAKLYERVWT